MQAFQTARGSDPSVYLSIHPPYHSFIYLRILHSSNHLFLLGIPLLRSLQLISPSIFQRYYHVSARINAIIFHFA